MNRRQLFFLLLVTALWTVPGAGFAQSGDTSSFGTAALGPVVPTITLSPWDRWWNFDHTAQWQAEAGAEWLRTHAKSAPFPFFDGGSGSRW
jgi:hypothetical protein